MWISENTNTTTTNRTGTSAASRRTTKVSIALSPRRRQREVRVERHPPAIPPGEDERGSPGPGKRRAVRPQAHRVPRDDHAQQILASRAVDLREPEGELADGRPDLPPLLVLERLSAVDDSGMRAET